MRNLLLKACVLAAALLADGCAGDGDDTSVAASVAAATAAQQPEKGDYGNPVRLESGYINVKRTVERLKEAKMNTYGYLIEDTVGTQDWERLEPFLTAAQTAGIDVWVFFLKPGRFGSDCKNVYFKVGDKEIRSDYELLAGMVGEVSTRHPNLKGWAIDDFGYGFLNEDEPKKLCSQFHPTDVAAWVSAGKSHNPKLEFRPLLYWTQTLEDGVRRDVLGPLRTTIDGLFYAFRDKFDGGDYVFDTSDPAAAKSIFETIGLHTACMGDVGGGKRGGGHCFQFTHPKNKALVAGDYAAISQTVKPRGTDKRTLTFYWRNDMGDREEKGKAYLTVLVGGKAVKSVDITSQKAHAWKKETVDLTDEVKDAAKLELRLRHAKDAPTFGYTVWLDKVSASGLALADGDFEERSSLWEITRKGTRQGAFVVDTIPVDAMIYTMPLTAAENGQAPSGEYVSKVLRAGVNATKAGYLSGTMLYRLPLAWDGEKDERGRQQDIFDAVKAIY